MEVRKDDEVERRQLVNVDCRIRQPLGMEPLSERNLLMYVDEGGIG
jgi:hypothetical protein